MSNQPAIYRIPFTGVVQENELQTFESDINELIDAEPRIRLAIDFSNTFHISSRAIGLLVAFHQEIGKSGGRMVLFGANPAVAKALAVTKIDTLVQIVSSEEEALAVLG